MKYKIVLIIIVILFIFAINIYYSDLENVNNAEVINNHNQTSEESFKPEKALGLNADDTDLFYLEEGKLFIYDNYGKPLQVPGDFSEMTKEDYVAQNHAADIKYGDIYFYYELDGKIFLVRSVNVSYNDWTVKELTNEMIGVESGSKIKSIIMRGSFGFIFYIQPDGVGKVLKSTTKGDYWSELTIDAKLDDTCALIGLDADYFLRVPSKDGEKCDLYKLNISGPNEIEKFDIAKSYDQELDYYMTPSYLNESGYTLTVEVGKNSEDTNPVKFVTPNWGLEWITEEEYYKREKESEQAYIDIINNYNKSVDNLDKDIFLIDFNNYNVTSEEVKISRERAEEIANIGFAESASRIASEGITDAQQETVEIEDVYPNNYFTRKYDQGDQIYNNLKRKAYVFSKYNSMGYGVSIYVDVTTGLILGAKVYSD